MEKSVKCAVVYRVYHNGMKLRLCKQYKHKKMLTISHGGYETKTAKSRQSHTGALQIEKWLFLDDIAAKTGFMVTEKGERAFQGTFYAARFLLNEQDF